jgi:hypothetical protein
MATGMQSSSSSSAALAASGDERAESSASPVSQTSVDSETLVEDVLNKGLPKYTLSRRARGNQAWFVVTLLDYPQCRGEAPSVSAAVREARAHLSAIRDCKLVWKLDEMLATTVTQKSSRGCSTDSRQAPLA